MGNIAFWVYTSNRLKINPPFPLPSCMLSGHFCLAYNDVRAYLRRLADCCPGKVMARLLSYQDRWALGLAASLGVVSPGAFKAPCWIIEFRLFLRAITSLLVQKAQDALSSLNFQCFSLLAPISSTPRMNTTLICHFCCWILLRAQYVRPKGSESRTSALCGSSWIDNHLSCGRNRYSSSTFCSLCHCSVLLCLSNKA